MTCSECGSDQIDLAGAVMECMNCGTRLISDPDLAAEDELWHEGFIRKGA